MKKSTTILLCASTAGISSLVTYILTRRHFQKKLESLCQNCREPHLEVPYTVTTAQTQDSDWVSDWQEAIKEQLNKYHESEAKTKVPIINTEDAPTEEEISEDDISLDPYVCTDEEFMNSEEKAYFTVYQDGVIADDKDKVIRNAAYYLGDDILNTLNAQGDDPLYVRNPVLNIAIEIGFSLEDYGA